ncbi:MAG: hypothetical protein LBR26_04385 [Prevotella sp.]|jgi:hypothetical protein|nr:hypothetical protein [Prevotella sp.]
MSNKMSTIKERILYVLEIKGITKAEFCRKIGMSYSNFTGEAKKTPLNSIAVGKILLELPDINPDWLLNEQGEVFRKISPSPTTELVRAVTPDLITDQLLDRIEHLAHENGILAERVAQLTGKREPLTADDKPDDRMPS